MSDTCDPKLVGYVLLQAAVDPKFRKMLARSPKAALDAIGIDSSMASDAPMEDKPPHELAASAVKLLTMGADREDIDPGENPQVSSFFATGGDYEKIGQSVATSGATPNGDSQWPNCPVPDVTTMGFLHLISRDEAVYRAVQDLATRRETLTSIGVPADIIDQIPDNATLPPRQQLLSALAKPIEQVGDNPQIVQFWAV
ncbi:MAG: hypothetical protein AAF610_06160 [Pseudomonadota bacterium]